MLREENIFHFNLESKCFMICATDLFGVVYEGNSVKENWKYCAHVQKINFIYSQLSYFDSALLIPLHTIWFFAKL